MKPPVYSIISCAITIACVSMYSTCSGGKRQQSPPDACPPETIRCSGTPKGGRKGVICIVCRPATQGRQKIINRIFPKSDPWRHPVLAAGREVY
ncbi:MAG: hypothetical protein JW913_15260 [Chitinispirillaceae bacterium]|nr:hypothetical protein [Chitinispirillaceae bacterium]